MVHPFASPPETIQTLGHLGRGDQERRADTEHVALQATDPMSRASSLAASYFGPAALTSS